MATGRCERGLAIGNDPFFNSRSEKLAELTRRHSVPAIYQYRRFVEAGGLISYGASNSDSHRQLDTYVGRILSGANPADLPVEQSTVRCDAEEGDEDQP
jgi:putative ABC transport system substrate-binding protein